MIIRNTLSIYEQIAQDILSKVESGEYKKGAKIPSEHALEEQYSVSRVTIRRAIELLVNNHVLVRKHGSGTFVQKKRINSRVAELRGLLEELRENGYKVECKKVETGHMLYEPRYEDIWEKLGADKSDDIYFIRRLYLQGSDPLAIESNFFPQEIGKNFEKFNLDEDIIYYVLDLLGYHIDYATQSISARLACEEEAELMNIDLPKAILSMERINYSETDQVILYANVAFAGDMYEYDFMLKRGMSGKAMG